MNIDWEERVKIEELYNQNVSQTEIAKAIHTSQQTITAEIKRGLREMRSNGMIVKRYYAEEAQADHERKQRNKSHKYSISDEALAYIKNNYNKVNNKTIVIDVKENFGVSSATVYRWIKNLKQAEEAENHIILKRGNKLYIEEKYQEAYSTYFQGAKIGDASCMRQVAHSLYRGVGVDQDFRKSFLYFRESARLGDSESMWWCGYMWDNGLGTIIDLNQAYYWYRKSADAGCENGMVYLAFFYEHGSAMTRDLKEAARWYKKAKNNIYAQQWIKENESRVINNPDMIISHTLEEYRRLYRILTGSFPSESLITQAIESGEISQIKHIKNKKI